MTSYKLLPFVYLIYRANLADVSELKLQEPYKVVGHFSPAIFCVRLPAPWPSKCRAVDGRSHVAGPGKPVASWWSGRGRTGVLHRRHGRSAMPSPHSRIHAWGNSVWFNHLSTVFFTRHRPQAIKLLDYTCLGREALPLLAGKSFLVRKDVKSWQQKPN